MDNLRALRNEKRISQESLAREVGSVQQHIHRYEKGENEPDIQMLKRLADFFDTSIDYLVGHTDIRHRIEPVERFDLNEDEAKLIEKYRKLATVAKRGIVGMIDVLLENINNP